VIFVCGDGSRMEPDVKVTLVTMFCEHTGADAAAGARWIEDLGTENRYVLDVWAEG
jgi:cytochrome P450/NADPH-cytochrome P450 reductase